MPVARVAERAAAGYLSSILTIKHQSCRSDVCSEMEMTDGLIGNGTLFSSIKFYFCGKIKGGINI